MHSDRSDDDILCLARIACFVSTIDVERESIVSFGHIETSFAEAIGRIGDTLSVATLEDDRIDSAISEICSDKSFEQCIIECIRDRERSDEFGISSDLIWSCLAHDRCDDETAICSCGRCDLVDLPEDDDTSCRRAYQHDDTEDQSDDIAYLASIFLRDDLVEIDHRDTKSCEEHQSEE